MSRVPSAAGADARQRDAGDAVTSSRSANAADAPAPPEPKGIWVCVAAQPHGGWEAISALLVVNDVPASPPPRALSSPPKPHARGPLYFHHGLLDREWRQATVMTMNHNNHIKMQTSAIPGEITQMEINEVARAIALYHKDGKYSCQTFFTPPRLAEVNWIEGFEKSADVYIRSIELIGTNLFHIRCVGTEANVRKVCGDPGFYNLLRGVNSTLSETVRSRWYLETTAGREKWDAIVALDKRTYTLVNHVNLGKKKTRIQNVIIVGDALLGLTNDGSAVMVQLTPDIFGKEGQVLDAAPIEDLNKLGKIDLLSSVPNSETSFLACIKNSVYELNLRGDMLRFQMLDDRVKRISSVDFNKAYSLMATNEGLFEIEVEELPDLVRAASLPRQIAHPELKGSFQVGHYVEDPYILGVHPAMGIVAKAEDDRVVCF
jgi:hypothetical protein